MSACSLSTPLPDVCDEGRIPHILLGIWLDVALPRFSECMPDLAITVSTYTAINQPSSTVTGDSFAPYTLLPSIPVCHPSLPSTSLTYVPIAPLCLLPILFAVSLTSTIEYLSYIDFSLISFRACVHPIDLSFSYYSILEPSECVLIPCFVSRSFSIVDVSSPFHHVHTLHSALDIFPIYQPHFGAFPATERSV